MKEIQKTSLFAAAAILVAAVAWLTGPSTAKQKTEDVRGGALFPPFDPLSVTRMEIMRFDETGRKFLPFEVAQVNGKWSIPSHSNYPADAAPPAASNKEEKGHLAEAAGSLMGLKIVDYADHASKKGTPADLEPDQNALRQVHNLYGVVDPDPESVKTSDTGVGMRVAMKDKEGKALLSIIIGKPLGEASSNLRYVRKTGQDPVYIVDVDTSKLSTKFEDWIEKDLLKLKSLGMDLKQVKIHDYAISLVGDRAALKTNGELTLDYNGSGEPRWKLTEDLTADKQGKPVNRKLADDEEVDAKKLDDLKFALDDLKIVDVNPKPPGLSENLKLTGDYAKDLLGRGSLMQRGFYAIPGEPENGKVYYSLYSNKGEVELQMNDGVAYVLRFGEVAGEPSAESAAPKAKTPAKKDDSTPGMNRYLFVMAEFNPDAIAKPALETPPQDKEEGGRRKEEGKKDEVKTEPAKKDETKKGDVKKDEAKKDAKSDEAKKDAKSDEAKKDAKGDEAKKDAKGDEAKKEPAKKEEKKPDLKAERERIEKENKRKQEEYDAKLAKGKEHAKELNARFAGWYYVISDDVYRKIHLGRDEIVKKKEKKDKDAKDQPAGHEHHHHDGDEDHDHADDAKPGPLGELEKAKEGAPGDAK
jgi:hypothetical protein